MLVGHIVVKAGSCAAPLTNETVVAALAARSVTVSPAAVVIRSAVAAEVTLTTRPVDANTGNPLRHLTVGGASGTIFYETRGDQAHVSNSHEAVEAMADRRRLLGSKRIFVVGAGGIGCELLKCLVLAGATRIVVVDLDTIDSTNLNRQFLFRKAHVGRSKALVAAEVVKSWRADASGMWTDPVSVEAIEGNVTTARFDVDWYRGFDVVINGLDNVAARKHVNRLCAAAEVPLVESGTMGYNGQVQPIVKGVTECYDCRPKTTEQKVFAVCTIHARPTSIVHCVHYAKEVYARLFGDSIAADTASELDYLNAQIVSSSGGSGVDVDAVEAAKAVYDVLFVYKIRELLAMKSDWTIAPPAPVPSAAEVLLTAGVPAASANQMQSKLTPPELFALLRASMQKLAAQPRRSFTKDDQDMVDFVAAIANLRALNFHIATESIHKVKTVAGNIVPAIASTNAIIAAVAVDAAARILAQRDNGGDHGNAPDYVALRHVAHQAGRRSVTTRAGGAVKVRDRYVLSGFPASKPNPTCLVCSSNQRTAVVRCNAALLSLGSFVRLFLMREMCLSAPTVDAATGTIYEHEDFEDLVQDPLTKWLPAARNAATILTVGDLHQDVEWTLRLEHDFSLDEVTFNVTSGSVAAPPPPPQQPQHAAGNEQQLGQPSLAAAAAAAAAADDGEDDDDVVAYHPAAKRGRAEVAHEAAQTAADNVVDVDDD